MSMTAELPHRAVRHLSDRTGLNLLAANRGGFTDEIERSSAMESLALPDATACRANSIAVTA